jgi:hypothetical protein
MNAFSRNASVMQRRLEPADSLDYFPTPPWGTRALTQRVLPEIWQWPDLFAGLAVDPCCGEGHMAAVLAEDFDAVEAGDIHPYGYGAVRDFLAWERDSVDWWISNPPFNAAEEFILHGLTVARRGVAALVRTSFLEGRVRHSRLFSKRPPQIVAQFVERLPMHGKRWVIDGKSATSYCWMVWLRHVPHDWRHCRMMWIQPSRQSLTRADDWLRFSGCMDLPKKHPAMVLQDEKREAT